MPGGEQAIYEPWRGTYAHLMEEMSWERFATYCGDLDLYYFLAGKSRRLLDSMMAKGINSPHASSCGRLFDAVAAAAGVCRERAIYEGQAAVEFEALVDEHVLLVESAELAYPFAISFLNSRRLPYVDPRPMWQALLADLVHGTPVPLIAARFHKGLAIVIVRLVKALSHHESRSEPVLTVALSGGVFQNRVLLEQVVMRLEAQAYRVPSHRQVPANDGGLALGQAVVAAARSLAHLAN